MRKATPFTRYAVLVVAFGLALGVSGCLGIGENKQGAPGPELKRADKEPVISVYDSKTKQKTEMPIEEYLAGVVAGEMLPNWPRQAYEAQAIVARTFTLDLINNKAGAAREKYGADVSTDETETQAYNADAITPVIRQAVRNTRGYVVTYRGKPIKAYFHACAGGRTALAREGLNLNTKEFPYSRSVRINEANATPDAKVWSASVPLTEVSAALAPKGIGQVQSISVAKRGPSRRVTRFAIKTAEGTEYMSGNDLRLLIGPEKMRSTLLTSLSVTGGMVKMSGKGFGHGVGMSQWGANTLASKGASGREIVRRFWKNIRVEQAWR